MLKKNIRNKSDRIPSSDETLFINNIIVYDNTYIEKSKKKMKICCIRLFTTTGSE